MVTARTIPCPSCARLFTDPDAMAQHRRATHERSDWNEKRRLKKDVAPICPKCGEPAKIVATQYGPRAACCGLHSWGLKPLVDPETHKARNAAHAAFDPLWRGHTVSRGEAYRILQIAMSMTKAECHISYMDADQARHVVEIVQSGKLLAEAGCSAMEIAAITGHKTLGMISFYTKGADQERMATAAIVRLQTRKL